MTTTPQDRQDSAASSTEADRKVGAPESALDVTSEPSEAAVASAAENTDDQAAVADTTDDASDSNAQPDDLSPEPALTPSAAAPAPPASRRGGAVLLLAGGVLAAVAGYGVAQLVPAGWPVVVPTAEIVPLATRIEALEAAQAAPATDPVMDPDLAARLTALEERLDALSDPAADLAALAERVAVLEAVEPVVAVDDAGAVAALQADLVQLQATVAALPPPDSALVAELAAELAAIKTAAAEERTATEARLAAARSAAEAAARAGVVQGAILRVQSALDAGGPLGPLLADLQGAGVVVPPELAARADGVATMAALRADFPPAARAALAAVAAPPPDAGVTDRLLAFVSTQTGLRSLTPRDGSDPDAILSRAEAALQGGDLDQALNELMGLPPPAVAALADWQGRAQARQAAILALAALARDLKPE